MVEEEIVEVQKKNLIFFLFLNLKKKIFNLNDDEFVEMHLKMYKDNPNVEVLFP